jgi:hypothetical protein
VRRTVALASGVFALHGAVDRLVLKTPDAGHDFPEPERLAAYAWLDGILR